jgi:hypothetical protein
MRDRVGHCCLAALLLAAALDAGNQDKPARRRRAQAPASAPAPADKRVDCRLLLGQLFRAGYNISKRQAIGFHGTSIEALELAEKTGMLAGSILPENAGGVYFYPNLNHPRMLEEFKRGKFNEGEGVVPNEKMDATDDAYAGAEAYAHRIAKEHRFMKLLGLEFTPEAQKATHNYMMDPNDRNHIDALVKLGAKRDQIRTTFEEAQKARGVVLFFGPRVLEEMEVTNARIDEDGLRIQCNEQNGVPLDMVITIEPLGDAEHDWLASRGYDEATPRKRPSRGKDGPNP